MNHEERIEEIITSYMMWTVVMAPGSDVTPEYRANQLLNELSNSGYYVVHETEMEW